MAIAFEPKPSTGIAPGGLGFGGKEILAKENVFVAIAIEISGDDSECGRELCLRGHEPRLETITAVQQNYRFEPVRLDEPALGGALAENFIDPAIGKGLIAGKARAQEGHCLGDSIQSAFGDVLPHRRFVIRFKQPKGTVVVIISEIKAERGGAMALVFGVAAPIT